MAVGSIIDGGTRSTNGIYEQDDVAYAFVMRHGLIQKKKIIPLNPQIETGKPEIWKLVSSITILVYLEAQMFKGIPKCDRKTCPDNCCSLDRDCA